MKIYRVRLNHDTHGQLYSWHPNKKDATKEARVCAQDEANDSIEVQLIEFPTDKKGLIEWLNIHLQTDNG